MNKWGIIAGILGLLLLFIPSLPIGIILNYTDAIILDAEAWIPLNLFTSQGIVYYSAGAIDNSMVIQFWFQNTYGFVLFILFWALPFCSVLMLLFFGFSVSPSGKKPYKISLIFMIIQNLSIILFPTVFGFIFSFYIYLFAEIPSILGYGSYLSFLITILSVFGYRQYKKVEDEK